jgi:hypothetical protein
VSVAALENILALPAVQPVVPVASMEDVGVLVPLQPVVSRFTVKDVGAAIALEQIVACFTQQCAFPRPPVIVKSPPRRDSVSPRFCP